MTLPKLLIDIPEDSYSFEDGEAVIRNPVSSGPSRQRLDMLDAPLLASVQLVLDPGQYDYWRLFYRASIGKGSLPFLLDLLIDSAGVTECQVQIRNQPRTSRRGDAHMVEFQLEVVPPASSSADDATLLLLYGIYGGETAGIFDRLAHLVNDVLPEVA